MTDETRQACVDACIECAKACEKCAADSVGDSAMAACVRLCFDGAAVGWLCASLMSRQSQLSSDLCELCQKVCQTCVDECDKHAACKECADAGRRCMAACAAAC